MKKEKNSLYCFLKIIYWTLMKILYRPTILGKENIPYKGSVIFAGNHKHTFDPLLVMMSTDRIVHYLAKEELFKGFHGKIIAKMGMIKVDRKKSNPLAVKTSEDILKNEGTIGIFPEGTRNKTNEELLKFRYGAVSIAQKANSVIVPFAIKGNYRVFRKGLVLEYGKPICVQNMEIEEANNYLRNQVLELLRK